TIKTPMYPVEAYAQLAALQPVGRLGEISDVVDAILYLEGAKLMLTGPPKLGVGGRTVPCPEVAKIPAAEAPAVEIVPEAVTVTGPPSTRNPLTALIPGTAAELVIQIFPDEFTVTERPFAPGTPGTMLRASIPAAACDWMI